jgi:hypothetical protein
MPPETELRFSLEQDDRFASYKHSAPLFLMLLEPLATHVPIFFEYEALTDALFTALLVNPENFGTIEAQAPSPETVTESAIIDLFNKLRKEYRALEGGHPPGAQRTLKRLWPKIEGALLFLFPGMSRRHFRIGRDLQRHEAFTCDDNRIYLSTLACLVEVALRAAN